MLLATPQSSKPFESSLTAKMRPDWVRALVAILGFCFALLSGLQMQRNQHGVDDFNQLYVGARLVFSGHLYSAPEQFQLQRETVGVERPEVSSSRLPFYYVMLWPLGRIPYGAARGLWFGILIAAAALFVAIYPTKHRGWIAAATAASLPLFAATLGQQQDLTILLAVIAASLRLRAAGYRTAAGFVLALLAIKIHLFLLVPVALVMKREWRMMVGLAGGGVALAGVSFAAAGLHWMKDYMAWMSAAGSIAGVSGMATIHGIFSGFRHAPTWELALSVIVTAGAVLAVRRARFEIAFAGAMLGSFLLSNHAYLHDCAILIPALVEIATGLNGSRWVRWTAVALLTPFPYFLPPLLFPIREGAAAAGLIGATLVGLAWHRRAT